MPDPLNKYQIFLSHASEDKPAVLQFAALLKSRPLAIAHQIDVWLDKTHVTSMATYSAQFAKAIHDREKTCGFILFMPEKNSNGDGDADALKPWVEHEVEQAQERRMQDKAAKQVFPMLYVYPGKRRMRMEPPAMIRNCVSYESVYDNDEVADAILKDMVAGLQHNANVQQARQDKPTSASPVVPPLELAKPPAPEPRTHGQGEWLCFYLSLQGDQISCEDDASNQTHCNKQALLATAPVPQRHPGLRKLFPALLDRPIDEVARVRLMTNDPELALMPWASLLTDYIVEVSPVYPRYQQGLDTLVISNPVIVIPEEHLAAGQHITVLQHYFGEYLGQRAVSRLTTADGLKHHIQFHQPDLIYIYARLEQQQVQLGSHVQDIEPGVSLETLGEWISQSGTRPLLVANLSGEELRSYPQSLVNSCRMVWIQSSAGDRKLIQMTDHFLDKLGQLTTQPDLLRLINPSSPVVGVRSHVWVSKKSPCLNTETQSGLAGQLRLALLRIMLGRESLKQSMYGHITDRNNHNAFMVYAVTGSPLACPFDFPDQLRQRLEDWDAQDNAGLPVIPYYFSLSIDSDQVDEARLVTAQENGLTLYSRYLDEAFEREFKRRGLLNQPKCIMLNWLIRVGVGQEAHLSAWLTAWGAFMHRELAGFIPQHTILLASVCLEVAGQEQAQSVQDEANQVLDTLYRHNIRLIENKEALGKLPEREIRNFLDTPKWHSQLKLDEFMIDAYDYAKWVHQHSGGGEFEHSVATLWTQYQNDYQDYLPL